MDFFKCSGGFLRGLGNRVMDVLASKEAGGIINTLARYSLGTADNLLQVGVNGINRVMGSENGFSKEDVASKWGDAAEKLWGGAIGVVDNGIDYFREGGVTFNTALKNGIRGLKQYGGSTATHNMADQIKGTGCLGTLGENIVDIISIVGGGDKGLYDKMSDKTGEMILNSVMAAKNTAGNIASWVGRKLGLVKKEEFECGDCVKKCMKNPTSTEEIAYCTKCRMHNCTLGLEYEYRRKNRRRRKNLVQRVTNGDITDGIINKEVMNVIGNDVNMKDVEESKVLRKKRKRKVKRKRNKY